MGQGVGDLKRGTETLLQTMRGFFNLLADVLWVVEGFCFQPTPNEYWSYGHIWWFGSRVLFSLVSTSFCVSVQDLF